MLSDTESYNIERTESTGNMDKFCQAICAFSNDISGSGKNGYLIIGAKDNGELSGLQVDTLIADCQYSDGWQHSPSARYDNRKVPF